MTGRLPARSQLKSHPSNDRETSGLGLYKMARIAERAQLA